MDLSQVYLVVELITALVGLIGTGVGAFFAVRNFIKAFKEKDAKQKWALIMEIADAAIANAEKTGAKGAAKKEMVVEAVKAGCKAAGLEMDAFVDQLSDYIDQTVSFVNNFNGLKK